MIAKSVRDFQTGDLIINTKERSNRQYIVTGTWQNMVSYHAVESKGETYQKPFNILKIVRKAKEL